VPDFVFAPLCTPGSPYSAEYAAAVTPGQPLPLFPMLMPEDWEHAPTQIKRTLYAGTKLRLIPDVALVYLVPTPGNNMPNIAWVRSERAQGLGVTPEELERVAYANVARRPASWSVLEVASGARVAMCNDDYLAAERILDPAFLRAAADRLGAPGAKLLVGVPTRGTLIASVYTGSQHDGVLAQLVEVMYEEARNKPISPVPFWVENGRIAAALELE